VKLIKHLLDRKGRHIISVKPDESVLDAIRLMAEKNIGALLVMENGRLLGIMSERDYARKVVVKGRASGSTPVADIMTASVVTTTSSETVNTCMSMMTDKRIRHLPVVDDNVVVGVISIGDLVQAIIADQQEAIEQLEHYISG
jgi:CBS domain-containing protein